jgi:hypothetical protein
MLSLIFLTRQVKVLDIFKLNYRALVKEAGVEQVRLLQTHDLLE